MTLPCSRQLQIGIGLFRKNFQQANKKAVRKKKDCFNNISATTLNNIIARKLIFLRVVEDEYHEFRYYLRTLLSRRQLELRITVQHGSGLLKTGFTYVYLHKMSTQKESSG